MQHIVKKTNLGIAVQEAIATLGLERQKTKIMQCLCRTFADNYEEFKKGSMTNALSIKGNYIIDNEFPIGDQDKQQYFRCLSYNIKSGNNQLITTVQSQRRPFMLIEGYSKNEDAKKRTSKAKTEEKRNMKSEDKLTKKRKLN